MRDGTTNDCDQEGKGSRELLQQGERKIEKGKVNLHQNVRTRRKRNLIERPLQNEERKSDLRGAKEKWGKQVGEE